MKPRFAFFAAAMGVGVSLVLAAALSTSARELKLTISSKSPFRLMWATNIPSFGLEGQSDVSSGSWGPYLQKPAIVGTNFVVTNQIPGSARVFRLSNWPQRTCENQMKQILLALEFWAVDNGGRLPWEVLQSQGGTRELRSPGSDGFDQNTYQHFKVISNELASASLLLCPGDAWHTAGTNFSTLQPTKVTYKLRTVDGVYLDAPNQILMVCPIDGNTVYCDSTFVQGTNYLK